MKFKVVKPVSPWQQLEDMGLYPMGPAVLSVVNADPDERSLAISQSLLRNKDGVRRAKRIIAKGFLRGRRK